MPNHDKEIWEKEVLIGELKAIYSLMSVSHDSIRYHNSAELEPVEQVLNLAYEKLFEVYDLEEQRLKAFKRSTLKVVNA